MNGRRMREIRTAAKLLQREVAEQLYLDNDTICQWELKDKKIPRIYEDAFMRLMADPEKVSGIIGGRRLWRRVRRYSSTVD